MVPSFFLRLLGVSQAGVVWVISGNPCWEQKPRDRSLVFLTFLAGVWRLKRRLPTSFILAAVTALAVLDFASMSRDCIWHSDNAIFGKTVLLRARLYYFHSFSCHSLTPPDGLGEKKWMYEYNVNTTKYFLFMLIMPRRHGTVKWVVLLCWEVTADRKSWISFLVSFQNVIRKRQAKKRPFHWRFIVF